VGLARKSGDSAKGERRMSSNNNNNNRIDMLWQLFAFALCLRNGSMRLEGAHCAH